MSIRMTVVAAAIVAAAAPARAELPMGLKCESKLKITDADVGEIGTYEVQKGMQKEKHTALLRRKKVKPVDGCQFPDLAVGQTVVVRYTGEQVGETEVQCIDRANGDAAVTFPKSIYTVRHSRIETYKMMPFCPNGVAPDAGVPCSKKTTQSERGIEYQETVLGSKTKAPRHLIDLVFDPPFRDSVPAGAKLFCALINRDGKVVIAGSAQY
jgi:hypothetical protein